MIRLAIIRDGAIYQMYAPDYLLKELNDDLRILRELRPESNWDIIKLDGRIVDQSSNPPTP